MCGRQKRGEKKGWLPLPLRPLPSEPHPAEYDSLSKEKIAHFIAEHFMWTHSTFHTWMLKYEISKYDVREQIIHYLGWLDVDIDKLTWLDQSLKINWRWMINHDWVLKRCFFTLLLYTPLDLDNCWIKNWPRARKGSKLIFTNAYYNHVQTPNMYLMEIGNKYNISRMDYFNTK